MRSKSIEGKWFYDCGDLDFITWINIKMSNDYFSVVSHLPQIGRIIVLKSLKKKNNRGLSNLVYKSDLYIYSIIKLFLES